MSLRPHVGPKSRPGDKRRRSELDSLYAELPHLNCMGLCEEACGPIAMSRVEWSRICTRRRKEDETLRQDLSCPMLEEGRCTVYDLRPMICRLWGLSEAMICPWGCTPDRYLTKDETSEFLNRALEIGA